MVQLADHFKGRFINAPEDIIEKLQVIKAFVFDWDGVFNAGQKDEQSGSPFNEVDSMGTNLLRFNHYLRTDTAPVTAIISGENNGAALKLARREHFHAVYCSFRHKPDAMAHLCEAHDIRPAEIAFFFDDVLDFSLAKDCGLRMMIGRACNPLMIDYAVRNNYVDYITACDGQNSGVRECAELLTGLSGRYDETMKDRIEWTERYRHYLEARNKPETLLFVNKDSKIIQQQIL